MSIFALPFRLVTLMRGPRRRGRRQRLQQEQQVSNCSWVGQGPRYCHRRCLHRLVWAPRRRRVRGLSAALPSATRWHPASHELESKPYPTALRRQRTSKHRPGAMFNGVHATLIFHSHSRLEKAEEKNSSGCSHRARVLWWLLAVVQL